MGQPVEVRVFSTAPILRTDNAHRRPAAADFRLCEGFVSALGSAMLGTNSAAIRETPIRRRHGGREPHRRDGGRVARRPRRRDERGDLAEDFVDAIGSAIDAGDAATLRALVGDLHEADLGDLLEALEPEERTALIRLLGDDFDFAALTELDETLRVQILEELPPETVAEGVRELESDDAVAILEDLEPEEQAGNPRRAAAGRAGRAGARPRISGGVRPAG